MDYTARLTRTSVSPNNTTPLFTSPTYGTENLISLRPKQGKCLYTSIELPLPVLGLCDCRHGFSDLTQRATLFAGGFAVSEKASTLPKIYFVLKNCIYQYTSRFVCSLIRHPSGSQNNVHFY